MVTGSPVRGSVERWTITSRLLADNPLGDVSVRDVWVYLPPGRGPRDCQGLPLILLLSGFAGRGRMLLADNLFAPAIDDRMDALIAAGCGPAVLALPDCSTSLGGSQYLDSPAVGRYQSHLIHELVPFLCERLRPGRIGVAGKSSGGYGALRLAMAAPQVFAAVASHSGDCYFEYAYLPDVPKAALAVQRAGSVRAFLDELAHTEKRSSEQIVTLGIIALSACYSPDADEPEGYRLPFDPQTGALRSEVFERWLEHDPCRLVERHAPALRSLRLLWLDAGRRDEFFLQLGARLLVRRLTTLAVPHVYEEFDDGHFSTSYRYGVSLPRLVQALED